MNFSGLNPKWPKVPVLCSVMWHLGYSIPQRSILGPVLFHVIINDTEKGIRCTLSTFADDTELSGAVDRPGGWDSIQCDLDKLESRPVMFNHAKGKLLHLGQDKTLLSKKS